MTLYNRITELQNNRPFGAVLDAGTGRGSMRWLLAQPTERWTAITGSQKMLEATRTEIGTRLRPQDRLIVGNWLDPELLAGEQYDTVLADYLLGAIEGFAPYWQDQLFPRLRQLVRGRFYVVGLEPYVAWTPEDAVGRMISDIGRLRDACLLLAGDRPYREYPLDWVLRHLRSAGFRVLDTERAGIRYGERFINTQLDMCSRALGKLQNRQVALAMQEHVAQLRSRAMAMLAREGGLLHGHDYIVVAEPDMPAAV
jgi:hypothetical protein